MRGMKLLLPVLVLVAGLALVPSAHAACPGVVGSPCVHLLGAGSSALFQGLGVAAVNDLGTATPHHFTIKGNCTTAGIACANLKDPRTSPAQIDSANLWVVYVCAAYPCSNNATDIWAYLQVDSVVGNRAFWGRQAGCAAPCHTSATLSLLDPGVKGSNVLNQSQNLISPSFLNSGVLPAASGSNCPGTASTCDDQFLPADVFTAISGAAGKPITMAGTDIRPEDALYATLRILTPRDDNGVGGAGVTDGLGYCGASFCNVGTTIASDFSSTGATPINFALPGNNDPITGVAVPDSTNFDTIAVGESPIVFIANRTNTAPGLGSGGTCGGGTFFYCNVQDYTGTFVANAANYPLGNLFGGNTNCDGADPAFGLGGAVPAGGDFPMTVLLREPLSGTMNTVEFSTFRIYGGSGHGAGGTSVNNSPTYQPPTSQEMNINPAADNPLHKTCGGGGGTVGLRRRVIGTGEMVSSVKATNDSLGYAFFSFGNVSSIANSASFGYLTLDGFDPLFSSITSGDPGNRQNGKLPNCVAGGSAGPPPIPDCTGAAIWTGGAYFPNLVSGNYRSWSALRVVCDNNDNNCVNGLGVTGLVAKLQDDIHCGAAGSCVAPQKPGSPDLLPFSQDGSFGPGNGYGDAGVIRSHYTFRINAAHMPNKYAYTHSIEKFKLSGFFANAAENGNQAAGFAEVGGDAGGCIIPAANSKHCTFTGATFAGGLIKYNGAACTPSMPVAGEYIVVGGLQSGGNTGVGEPDNGVFQINSVSASPSFIKVSAATGDTATPTATGAEAVVDSGCSQ